MVAMGSYLASRREAATIRSGDVFGRTEIVGGRDAPGPHAYLVEQAADVELRPHFHLTDQFQVAVRGSGRLGRHHALAPVTVHYARGKTAYGPIVAGPEGLDYLVLRPRVEYGGHYLDDPQTEVDREAPKFHRTSATVAPEGQASGPQALIVAADDGLAAWLVRASAGRCAAPPIDRPHAGRFHVVLRGSAQLRGEALALWSCIWCSAGEDALAVDAGDDGLTLLTLQFPARGHLQ